MTSHPSRSYTLETSSACPTACVPSTTIVRTLCVSTLIFHRRARARFLVLLCRRRRRSALPCRLGLCANIFVFSVTFSIYLLSSSPLSRCGSIFRLRSESGAYSQARLLLPAFRGGTPALVSWYGQSDLWIQLAVHRRCHRLCRYNHSTPGVLIVS